MNLFMLSLRIIILGMEEYRGDSHKVNGVEVNLLANANVVATYCCQTDGYTLLLVRQGNLSVEIDFTRYDVSQNMTIMFAPKTLVRYIGCSDDLSCSILSFDHDEAVEAMPRPDPEFMDFMRRYPKGKVPAQRADAIHLNMADIAYFLYQNNGEHRISIVRNIIQNIIFEMYDAIKVQFLAIGPNTVNRQGELFMQFIHLVYEYGAREREVAFYCSKLCITPRYLARILRELSHETPKKIIDRHCIQEIKKRLRTTNDSVQAIAIDLRFPDQSFFTRYFKKQTGMTPKDFRKQEL